MAMMGRMRAIEAWLLAGPVAGRLMPVEMNADDRPPQMLDLLQTGDYVGSSDVAAPQVTYRYILVDPDGDPVVYQYHGPVAADVS